MLLIVGAAVGAPAAIAGPGPAGAVCATQSAGEPCVDPLASADSEDVGAVQQPGWGPLPGYDTLIGNWGGSFRNASDKTRMDPAITVGAGHIYVVTDNPSAPYGAGLYEYSQDTPNSLIAFVQLNKRFSGITYYHGELYVGIYGPPRGEPLTVAPGQGEIDVYDPDLTRSQLKRALPFVGDMSGFDIAGGEIWARISDVGGHISEAGKKWGLTLDYLEILDPQSGALRGIQPISIASYPRADLSKGAFPSAPEMAKDVAISPELGVVSTGNLSLHRATNYDLASVDASTALGGGGETEYQLLADPGCDPQFGNPWLAADSAVGAYAPWGMKWLIQVDSCVWQNNPPVVDPWIFESALSVDTTGWVSRWKGVYRQWRPNDATTDTVRDIAYRSHEATITWSGNPTRSDWQHGSQSLTYFVSDGDYYIVGNTMEHWFQPAHGFQSATVTATPTDANGDPTGSVTTLATTTSWSGTLQLNEDSLPSGTYALTMTATVDGGKLVTKTNPNFRVDHTPPAGTLDALPAATNADVNATGTISDAHSGPAKWQLQINGPGTSGNWQTACTTTAADPSGKWGCTWHTAQYPEGTYQVRALLSDSVTSAYGGANTATVGNATVIVDRTAPTLANFAPALGQDDFEEVVDDQTDVSLTDTDGGSGIASTTASYNAAPSGRCDGGWKDIGSSSASGDVDIPWDTQGVQSDLVCMRAVGSDRAGNTTSRQWQTVVSAERPSAQPQVSSTGASGRYYAGETVGTRVGAFPSRRSWGVSALLTAPGPLTNQYGAEGGTPPYLPAFSAARVANGASGKTRAVETGLITKYGCPNMAAPDDNNRDGYPDDAGQPTDSWWVYGAYSHPPGSPYPGTFQTNCVTQTQSQQRYRAKTELTLPGGNLRGAMWWRPPGATSDRLIYATEQVCPQGCGSDPGTYQIRRRGGRRAQAVSETNDADRRMPGYYANVRWRTAATGTSWPLVDGTKSDRYNQSDSTDPFNFSLSPTQEPAAAFFCTFGPKRDSGEHPDARAWTTILMTGCAPPGP